MAQTKIKFNYNINTDSVNYFNQKNEIKQDTNFDYHQLPKAYLCDNTEANALRSQFIQNQIKINECEISDLPNGFFSDENIKLINNKLILEVYKKTNGDYKIRAQSSEQLLIVMRYIFHEYARHLPYDIKGQISELNCRVVSEILPNVITNAQQHIGYLRDIEKIRDPLPLPISTKYTSTSSRTLPSRTTTY
jgi:hypothetical protein